MTGRVLLSLVTASVLFSCGRKAPPFLPVPVAPQRLSVGSVVSDGERVLVSFRVPRERFSLKGEEERWAMARLLRGLSGAAGDTLEERAASSEEGGFDFGQELTLADEEPREGETYLYRVELRKKESKEWAASETFAVNAVRPPGLPRNLIAEGREGAIALSWDPPEGAEKGLEYRVLRREADGEGTVALRAVVVRTGYTDTRVEREREYCYRIVPVRPSATAATEGKTSPELCGRTVDRTPPPPPRGLTAAVVGESVTLTWLPVRAEDLRGYNVYRAEEDGPFRKVNSEPVGAARYLDPAPARGARLSYRVSAVDDSRNENESPFSEVASALVPP